MEVSSMSIFQVFSTLFALFMLYILNIHYRKRVLSTLESNIWRLVWVVFILISLFPTTLLGITDLLHFARVFDLLVVAAFMILTTLVISVYFSQKELLHRIEHLFRDHAITETKKSSRKKTRRK